MSIGRPSLATPILVLLATGATGAYGCGSEGDVLVSRYAAPLDAPYEAENVTFTTPAGLSLAGTLTLPIGTGPSPGLVMISGSGRQDRDEHIRGVGPGYRPFRQIADTLSRRGIATFRLDDRGVGGSDAGPDSATVFDVADDFRAALAYLRNRPEIDPERLALLGHSEGGVIAPMVAASDTSLAALVLLAGPAYTLQRVNRFQRGKQFERAGTLTPEEIESELDRTDRGAELTALRNPWRGAVWNYDPLPTARTVRVPVLLLQGATDVQISPEQADTLAAAFRDGGNADITLHLFHETNHMFLWDDGQSLEGYRALPSDQVRKDVLGVLADWLVRRVGGLGDEALEAS